MQVRELNVQFLNLLRVGKVVEKMPKVTISRGEFLADRQGRTFADVAGDAGQVFDEVLRFFSDADRQRRMEESELHHDRAPLAGVVRELESLPAIERVFQNGDPARGKRLRQAIGVVVRMIMEGRGWRKTGRKGSLGVRAPAASDTPQHNTGGLALYFLRAERYERNEGMPFRSVRYRCEQLESAADDPATAKATANNGSRRKKKSAKRVRP